MSYHRKLGRVHWLLWHLPKDFLRSYNLHYNYAYHNYTFIRFRKRTIRSFFVVQQSSRHYWRVMYVDLDKQKYEYFGFRNTRILAQKMDELFKMEEESDNIS